MHLSEGIPWECPPDLGMQRLAKREGEVDLSQLLDVHSLEEYAEEGEVGLWHKHLALWGRGVGT